MKCPVCGNEIKDEQLYCESCGYEIHIVPDFDPEIENNIQETMTGVVSELTSQDEGMQNDSGEDSEFDGGENEEVPWYAGEERPNLLGEIFRFITKRKRASAVVFGVLVVLVAVTAILLSRQAQKNTYEYQYKQGVLAAEKKDYERAISCMKQALQYDNQQGEARMLMADYYWQIRDMENAISLYHDLTSYEEFRLEAYEKIISIYKEEGRFLDVCNLVEHCEYPDVRAIYNEYLAEEPIFSIAGGVYEEAQMLKISANTNGIIYYTLDGSLPDEADMVYTGSILLESGEYRVSAVFINKYGMMSKIRVENYKIEADIPDMPVVIPEGGIYLTPEYISVEVPRGCRVYYTTDGTVPNRNCAVFTKDFCMPLGDSIYCFVTYNEENVASEAAFAEYHLYLEDPHFSAEQAVMITISGLTERGILLNTEGQISGAKGIYSYQTNSAFFYEGEIYYLVSEYYTDESGSTYMSTNKYAVGVDSGILYRTDVDVNDHYSVISFE